eukprot:GILI01034000.1.p1 GENE.GILI01034000.1~~GILI01034000.1.p1  ORF type:complete len:427 (+),score=42.25 GILI01034000.1:32-1312(+)
MSSGGTLRIDSDGDKMQLIEHIVSKRTKFLEYLRQMHTSEPEVGVLWMNVVRIRRADILNYFNVDPGFVSMSCSARKDAKAGSTSSPKGQVGKPTFSQQRKDSEFISFTAAAEELSRGASAHSEGLSSPLASSSIPLEMVNMNEGPPPPTITAKVESGWIKEKTLPWFLLGTSLAAMLQAPKLYPCDVFVEATTQLLMEVDIFTEKAGSASKMLSIRSLRNYRNDNPSYWNDTEETVVDALPPQPTSQGFNKVLSPWRNCGTQTSQIFFERQCCRCADKNETTGCLKYHFLDLTMASMVSSQIPPAYEATVPALCSVLSMTYQRFLDFDTALRPGVARKIVAIDKKLKHIFFGALSREIAVLAQAKLVQQATFMSTRVFAAYSHADQRNFLEDVQAYEAAHPIQKETLEERETPRLAPNDKELPDK